MFLACWFQPSSASSNGTASNGDIATTTVGGAGWSTSASSTANGVVEQPSATSSTSPLPQYSPVYLQVCREYERATCSRASAECRFAHPPDNVAVDTTDNTVTVCMDFIKGKCSRDSCRYFHPPPHLQAQIKLSHQRANAAAAATPSPQLVGFLFHCFLLLLLPPPSSIPLFSPCLFANLMLPAALSSPRHSL